jgi:hypothetical protein
MRTLQKKRRIELFYLALAQGCSCYGVLAAVEGKSHQPKCDSCPRQKSDIITKPLHVVGESFTLQQDMLYLPAKT